MINAVAQHNLYISNNVSTEKLRMIKNIVINVLAGFALLTSSVANAGMIIGGSDIIDNDDLLILGNWLGKGDIDLTNVFTKNGISNNSTHWHAAVDGKGATFTLIQVGTGQNSFVFGGYNDYSWLSNNNYRLVDHTVDKSFLFSLTNNLKFDRVRHSYSTYNSKFHGATFGGGHDLYVNNNLTSGYSYLGNSYGDVTRAGNSDYINILAGSYIFNIEKYETFTISQASPTSQVPAPSTLAIFALAIIGLVSHRFKKKS